MRFFFAPAALLAAGFFHGELTSLLWGGAFGFLWAYVGAARTTATLAFRTKGHRGTLEAIPGPALLFRTDSVPTAPAFFAWSLRLEGVHSPQRRFDIRVPLSGELTTVPLDPPRGRYQVTAHWELRDAFGFSRWEPPVRWQAVITVEPEAQPFEAPRPPPTRTGPWRPRRSGRRTGDPFDVRPYNPGDDLRRLHWPLYAHSDTLFVRTAEPSPPPSGHQFLVLDTEANSEEALDHRLGAMVAWLKTLDAQGTGWTLLVPAADLTLKPGAEVGAALAALVPATLPEGPVDPGWPETVTVLTGPSSAGASRLAGLLAASRRRCHPVPVAAPGGAVPPSRPWWKR